ncbi:MAG: hypothetical protein JWM68_5741 [Verrucomicrobiales bacterium]|nr:hypothetical protein [Verrucomicrobiales bacterium]
MDMLLLDHHRWLGSPQVNKFLFSLLVALALSMASTAFAEEKMVTTPLLTALSSTTISGYIDTSAHWNPGTTNLVVTLPNKKRSSLTARDIIALQWALKLKQVNFFRTFVSIKERLADLPAEEFDAKFLPLLFPLSGVSTAHARLIMGTPPPSAY